MNIKNLVSCKTGSQFLALNIILTEVLHTSKSWGRVMFEYNKFLRHVVRPRWKSEVFIVVQNGHTRRQSTILFKYGDYAHFQTVG